MKISCNIFIGYSDSIKAKKMLKSIKVDDFEFVKSKVNKNRLEAEITSKSISSLLHTIDDYLACLSVAEKIVDKN